MPLHRNSRLGRYLIQGLIGKGGMGEVYLAEDSNLKRPVAIKLLPAELIEAPLRLKRFEREAHSASSLNHPNILTIYEIGEIDGQRFIASEYVEGENLRQRMTRERMSLKEVLHTIIQVASALAAAERAGIVHRDIKPENIMLRKDGYVKVLDFGLAKLVSKTPDDRWKGIAAEAKTITMTDTAPGIVLGTVSYMSPEQARGRDVDARSDIWSLGVVLYEMLSGNMPFAGETSNDVIAAILKTEPPPLPHLSPDLDPDLNDIVTRMLSKEQEKRYQSCYELLTDLEALKQKLESSSKGEWPVVPGLDRDVGTVRREVVHSEPAPEHLTTGASTSPPFSRSGYLSRIKRYRLTATLVLIVLAIVLVAGAYFYSPVARSEKIASVAVLPFVNESGDEKLDYLADGLSEYVRDRLSELPQLKVTARSSSFRYKSPNPDPHEVGGALGVQALVLGRVLQQGDNLHVRVELVNARDKTQMWGEQYTVSTGDIQRMQTDITRKISDKLRPELSSEEQKRATTNFTDDRQAYHLYLEGRFYSNKLTEADLKKSIEYFNQAIAKDPNYALAYAGMANSYLVLGANHQSPQETYPKAKLFSEKALKIDPTLAEAHYAMAATNYYYDWNFPEAEKELTRTQELNPNYAPAYILRSNIRLVKGQANEAIGEIRKALELDPFSLLFNNKLSSAYYFARDYKRSLDQLKKTLELEPNASFLHSDIGVVYAQLGMFEEALAECQKGIILQEESPGALASLGLTYALWGKRKEALWVIETLNKVAEKRYVQPYFIASLYAALGDSEKAMDWLEKASSERAFVIYLGIDPIFDKYRSHPRYKAIIERLQLGRTIHETARNNTKEIREKRSTKLHEMTLMKFGGSQQLRGVCLQLNHSCCLV